MPLVKLYKTLPAAVQAPEAMPNARSSRLAPQNVPDAQVSPNSQSEIWRAACRGVVSVGTYNAWMTALSLHMFKWPELLPFVMPPSSASGPGGVIGKRAATLQLEWF